MGSHLIDQANENSHSEPEHRSLRERLHVRTGELAVINGHGSQGSTQHDYEQAKRDVTGESDTVRQNAVLDLEEPKSRAQGFSRAKPQLNAKACQS